MANINQLLICSMMGLGTAFASDGQKFDIDLLQQVSKTAKGNVCISPYSAASCLSLLTPGAGGNTLKQMQAVLGDTSGLAAIPTITELSLETANRVYINTDFPIAPAYAAALPKDSVVNIDFSGQPDPSRITINKWVEGVTHDRIKDLLPPNSINPMTRLVAVNAIYMKDKWMSPFKAAQTTNRDFKRDNGAVKQVPTMFQSSILPCVVTKEYSAISLDYRPGEGKNIEGKTIGAMIAILPPEGVSVDDFVRSLTPDSLANIRKSLNNARNTEGEKPTVELFMPKFKFEADSDLSEPLKNMGMDDAFGENADFSKMTTTKMPLYVSAVYQKCFVAVDEDGTEAAAATAAVMMMRSAMVPKERISFALDRPFVWMIVPDRDSTDSPALFMGIVREP